MTQPFVSAYTEEIRKAFENIVKNEDFVDQEKIVKNLVDNILENVTDRVHDYVSEELINNIKDAVCSKAAEVAEHMLRDALAGNDKQLRNLFGFNEWYMKHAYAGGLLPRQWELLDAIVERNPQFFVDERLAQKDKEITLLKDQYNRMKEDRDRLHTVLAKVGGHY